MTIWRELGTIILERKRSNNKWEEVKKKKKRKEKEREVKSKSRYHEQKKVIIQNCKA